MCHGRLQSNCQQGTSMFLCLHFFNVKVWTVCQTWLKLIFPTWFNYSVEINLKLTICHHESIWSTRTCVLPCISYRPLRNLTCSDNTFEIRALPQVRSFGTHRLLYICIYLAYDFYYSYDMLHFNVLVLACFSFCFYRLKILLSPLASTPTDWWAIWLPEVSALFGFDPRRFRPFSISALEVSAPRY